MIGLIFEADLLLLRQKAALDAAKNGKYLKFLVEDSDKLAKKIMTTNLSTYTTQAQVIVLLFKILWHSSAF